MRAPLLSLVLALALAAVATAPAACASRHDRPESKGAANPAGGEERQRGGSIKPLSLDGYGPLEKAANKEPVEQQILDVHATPAVTADTYDQEPIEVQAGTATASAGDEQPDEYVEALIPDKVEDEPAAEVEKEKSDESDGSAVANKKAKESDYLDESASSKKEKKEKSDVATSYKKTKKKEKTENSDDDSGEDASLDNKEKEKSASSKKEKKDKSDDSDEDAYVNKKEKKERSASTKKQKKDKSDDSDEDAYVNKKDKKEKSASIKKEKKDESDDSDNISHRKEKKEKRSDDYSDNTSPKKEKEKKSDDYLDNTSPKKEKEERFDDSDEATSLKKQKKEKKSGDDSDNTSRKREKKEKSGDYFDMEQKEKSAADGVYVSPKEKEEKSDEEGAKPVDVSTATGQYVSSSTSSPADAYASPKQQITSRQPNELPPAAAKGSATSDPYELPALAGRPKMSMESLSGMIKRPLAKMLSPVIKRVCAKTEYPADCEASIGGLRDRGAAATDSAGVLRLAMEAVRQKAAEATSAAADRMDAPGTDPATRDALGSCTSSYGDIRASLDTADDALRRGDVDAAHTNLDSVETDVTTCDDGFQERGTPSVMADHDQELQKLASNLLSIGAAIHH